MFRTAPDGRADLMVPHALDEGFAYAAVADVLLERERFEQSLIGSLEQKGHVGLPQIAKGRPAERQMLAYPVCQRDAKCRGKVVIAGQRFTDAHIGVFAQMPPQLIVRDPGKAIGGALPGRREASRQSNEIFPVVRISRAWLSVRLVRKPSQSSSACRISWGPCCQRKSLCLVSRRQVVIRFRIREGGACSSKKDNGFM